MTHETHGAESPTDRTVPAANQSRDTSAMSDDDTTDDRRVLTPRAVTDGGVRGTTHERIDTLLYEIVEQADDPQIRERAREVLQLRKSEVSDR